ncbi:SpoIIE family protein phosphatase [Streptomyces sp. B93]|uniref:SpoIIE family protein phosphatase n=1 Tax=Streptomyces sp. B93 TaxID=2824875 RepID=UPI001B36DC6A|nr:SpoIIE family protein phosphatase [Streptomyces sp. B93]MBQ1089396.1 SpoIIE family protein phosphatase [Streptomyces sp. B93]
MCGVHMPGEVTLGPEALDPEFAETVRRTGASIGALYLLESDERLLRLEVLSGASAEIAAPWARVPVAAPAPVADAVREDRLVWLGSQEEVAHRYPRTAMALPYPMAMAAVPVSGVRRWGALLLMWPSARPPYMTGREHGHLMSRGRRLARLLEETADGYRPTSGEPRVVDPTGRPAVSPAMAAADFVERLPGGSCSLDLEGHFTYLSSGAERLLGRDADQLLGTLPWLSLRWLDDPVYEDHYRAAVLSRQHVTFTARRPPGQWLEFHLFPDASGISVRVLPAGATTGQLASPVTATDSAAPARAGQLYQLMHLAAALTEVVGVRDIIDLIADQIMPAFGAQGLVLSVADAGRLRIIGHRGYAPRAIERLDALALETDFTPAGRALATGVPAFFADADEMRRSYPEAPQVSGKQAWAFLPLVISGQPVGCCVLSYERPHEFTAEERAVLTSLAGLVAQSLDRARLYDTKHALAHGLQQALLPHALPEVTGLRVAARYLPATRGMEIGGDFYDVIRLGPGAAAAVIGDVQGHNVAAAALMGQVRTAVHAHATLGASPGQVLAATNRLLDDLGVELFTSCLYAHLDFVRQRVTVASAGHPPPLLRLPDGDTRPLVVPPGPLLGIDPDAAFPVAEVLLPPGSLLALYTDGLIEMPGSDLDDSIAQLARQLADAGDQDLDLLIENLLEHTEAARRRTDDVALLVLRHEAAGARAPAPHT